MPLTPSDRRLIDPLRDFGFVAEAAIWADLSIQWSDYAGVVIRSTWDYHHRPAEFRTWADRVEASGTPLMNPARLVRWNSSKTYLIELAEQGVPIPPTALVARGSTAAEIAVAASTLPRAREVVVKPTVSASAYSTWRAPAPLTTETIARIESMAGTRDVILQPFLDTIVESGELSLVFFDGVFSHAARKRPKEGDFRVQTEHGGETTIVQVRPDIVDQAERALRHAPDVPTYARVDGIDIDGVFTLMELELIEPELFFVQVPDAAVTLASAIARRIDG